MYSEKILELLQQAEAKPLWNKENITIFTAETGIKATGLWLQLWLRIENDIIIDIRYRVMGGGYLIATTEWINRILLNKSIQAAQALTAKDIVMALALPDERMYCAQMIIDCIDRIVRQINE